MKILKIECKVIDLIPLFNKTVFMCFVKLDSPDFVCIYFSDTKTIF